MTFPSFVKIVEVGPRDGLQNEKEIIPTVTKVELINRLSDAGLTVIEATSFVSPKWIPQLADGSEVYQAINKKPHVQYPVLVPNVTGLEHAMLAGCNTISVFTTASEAFSEKNTHCSVADSIKRIEAIMLKAKENKLWVRAYLSCVLGCPYEGDVPPEKTMQLAKTLYDLGVDEISLGDTIGVGTPFKTLRLIEMVGKEIPIKMMAVHFHDTYGQALANLYAALSMGIEIVDSAVAGLGGCPYAKGATGNVATEEVLYMLQGMAIQTGVELKKIVEVGRFIAGALKHPIQSKVNVAMTNTM